jgi:hypothetical protein
MYLSMCLSDCLSVETSLANKYIRRCMRKYTSQRSDELTIRELNVPGMLRNPHSALVVGVVVFHASEHIVIICLCQR